MKRLMCLAAGLALLAGLEGRGQVGAQNNGNNNRMLTVKEIMDRLHKGQDPPLVMLKRDLQANQTDWEDIQKTSRIFVTLGAALGTNSPPRGDKASWDRLTRQYFNDAQAMDEAAGRKDKPAVMAARNRLAGSCAACHRAHKSS